MSLRTRDGRLVWAIVLAMLAGAAVLGWTEASSTVGDTRLFADWGSTMLSGHWARTFDDPAVQAGPLELALAGAAVKIGGSGAGFAIALDLVCTFAIAAAALLLFDRRASGLAIVAAGSYLLWLPGQAYLGHPAELLIALLWVFAARYARDGRTTLAGVLIGISACLELWGVLGITVLALAPSLRRSARGLPPAALLPIASLAPFFAAGTVETFRFHWTIQNGLPRLLLGAGGPYTWQLRFLEAALVVAAGTCVARAVRRSPSSIWIVPAATVLLRMALDPVIYPYYWNTAQLLIVIGVAELVLRREDLRHRLLRRGATPGTEAASEAVEVQIPSFPFSRTTRSLPIETP